MKTKIAILPGILGALMGGLVVYGVVSHSQDLVKFVSDDAVTAPVDPTPTPTPTETETVVAPVETPVEQSTEAPIPTTIDGRVGRLETKDEQRTKVEQKEATQEDILKQQADTYQKIQAEQNAKAAEAKAKADQAKAEYEQREAQRQKDLAEQREAEQKQHDEEMKNLQDPECSCIR